jgi:alkylation response protein AidB-like acyl-CoA dehydrogenase
VSFNESEQLEATQASLDAWVAQNWSDHLTLRQWWDLLAQSGLAMPTWPRGFGGRGWDRSALTLCARSFASAGAIGAPTGLGTLMGGPVVLQFGTEDQKTRLLPPLAKGIEGWCQLFSEPGAGSDLASLSTKAERDGDEWVINGQKVWTSGSQESARGMLLARTDVDQPKHRGITYFIVDLHQPGVEIRPLRQMNGRSHFSEVFFTDARVHDRDRIGHVNNGWAAAVATLAYERSGLSAADGVPGVRPAAGEFSGHLDINVRELINRAHTEKQVADDAGGKFDLLRDLNMSTSHHSTNAFVRQRLVAVLIDERIAGYTQRRAIASARAGKPAGPEASLAKLFWTQALQTARDGGTSVLGADGMLVGDDAASNGVVQQFALTIPSARIAGGSDEIQRNIIGERVLGLPKEPSSDTDLAFRDLRRS